MSKVKSADDERSYKPLVSNGGYYVLVSHNEIDDLIGRMMQLFELNGDVEQRNALKQETKWRCREWLDALYEDSGYSRNHSVPENVPIYKLELKTN